MIDVVCRSLCRVSPVPLRTDRLVVYMQVLAGEEWDFVKSRGRMVRFGDGDVLSLQGAEDKTVFFIESGQVKIMLAAEDGRQISAGLRRVGEMVGEMAAIDGHVRSASMVARGQVVAFALSRESFLEYLALHPEAALRVMRRMAERTRQASLMYLQRGDSLGDRVGGTLLALSIAEGSAVLDITQQELAEWVGASREATGRVVGILRSAGLISTSRGVITLLNAEELGSIRFAELSQQP